MPLLKTASLGAALTALTLAAAHAGVEPPALVNQTVQGATDSVHYGDYSDGQPQNLYVNSGVPLEDLFTTTFPSTATENPGSISVQALAEDGTDDSNGYFDSDPFVSLTATANGSSLIASVGLTYYLEIIGTTGDNPAIAPVDLHGVLSVGAPGSGTNLSASATAGLVIRDDSGNIILNQSAAGEYGIPLQLDVGEIYGISLTATANITDPHGEFTIQASSDPTFTLTGPDASQYQILYSPGVVPEPPACLMLMTGLLGLGFGLFQRRGKLLLAR